MIHTAMRYDRLGRPGVTGYLLDLTRWTLAFTATYATAVVAPAVLGGAGALAAAVVTAAALIVAVPGYLAWSGVAEGWAERLRAGCWAVLVLALAAVAAVNAATAGVVLAMVGNDGLLLAVGLGFFRGIRAADVRVAARRTGRD